MKNVAHFWAAELLYLCIWFTMIFQSNLQKKEGKPHDPLFNKKTIILKTLLALAQAISVINCIMPKIMHGSLTFNTNNIFAIFN